MPSPLVEKVVIRELSDLRQAWGLSQAAVAAGLPEPVSQSEMSLFESGTLRLSRKRLVRIVSGLAAIFDKSPATIESLLHERYKTMLEKGEAK